MYLLQILCEVEREGSMLESFDAVSSTARPGSPRLSRRTLLPAGDGPTSAMVDVVIGRVVGVHIVVWALRWMGRGGWACACGGHG